MTTPYGCYVKTVDGRTVVREIKYKELSNQVTFFHHITNFVARQESGSSRILVPSAYLNVEVTDDQVELLKPSVKHVMMGAILAEAAGKGARKLIAKRRIDIIDGNIGSYSRLLNSDARMEMIRDVNALAAAVAEISKEKLDARDRLKESADQQALKKAEKVKGAELKHTPCLVYNCTTYDVIQRTTRGVSLHFRLLCF